MSNSGGIFDYEQIWSKQNLIVVGIIIVVVLVVMWLFRTDRVTPEQFHQEMGEEMINQEEMAKQEGEIKTTPELNPMAVSVMDGPGYTNNDGNVEGIVQDAVSKLPSNYYFLQDGGNPDGEFSIQNNYFSPSCCSAQFPLPFKLKVDPYVCQNKGEFVGSNIFGNSTFGNSGCACLTKKQAQFLYNRGMGAREWF